QVIILLIISLILNVNLTMVGLGAVVSSLISWALDPLLNSLGSYVLTDIPQLTGLFTIMFNSTFWMLTRFNNTVVMGGFVLGVFSAVPLYFIFKQMVVLIRKNIVTKLADSKLAKVIKRSWIYGIYSKINAVGTRI
ncbi:MAG: TIGR03546 family protein, partial [Proteobacteria bacterium]|nr:TIGR03546 family protein [Pseudomonadota bacterium]